MHNKVKSKVAFVRVTRTAIYLDYITYSSRLKPLMSLVLSQRSSPVPSQPLPPSPDEQDLGGRATWYHGDDESDDHDANTIEHSQHGKGKAKLLANGATDGLPNWPDPTSGTEAYPPTTEEEADTRRVQGVRAFPLPCLCLTSVLSVEPKTMGNCRTTALEGSAQLLYHVLFRIDRCCPPRHVVLVTSFITPSSRWWG